MDEITVSIIELIIPVTKKQAFYINKILLLSLICLITDGNAGNFILVVK